MKTNSKTAIGSTAETLAGGSSAPRSLRVHFSSATDEWATPQWLFDELNARFAFTLDPCATPQNAKCSTYFTRSEDGLVQDWGDNTVFMNPPYGRAIGQWMKKAYEASRIGATVVCLVPARTDTAWWHCYALKGKYRFLRGRLRFEGGKHSAPFPSAIVVFRPHGQMLRAA
jgi:site-specific DNA-methyltransferase (adenine-specific)